MEAENLCARSRHIGEILEKHFTTMAARPEFACIGEIRGLGAMRAIELVKDRTTRTPAPELSRACSLRALANGLLILNCGLYGNTLRVLTPLTISDQHLNEGLAVIEKSLTEALAETH
jgi:4-aminobutyrate aminotransferase-like enzyme